MPSENRKPHVRKLQAKKQMQQKVQERTERIALANSSNLGLVLQGGFRQSETRRIPDKFLIVCEGEKTEPNYFNWLRTNWKLKSSDVHITGKSGDPLGVIRTAISMKSAAKGKNKYDQVWAVFDRDNFSNARLGQAFLEARNEGIFVAFSNESFELWYLLHYNLRETSIGRKELCDELSELFGEKYEKSSRKIFTKLKLHMKKAVTHAKYLVSSRPNEKAPQSNPYTGVYLLVEEFAKNASFLPLIQEEIKNIFPEYEQW